MTLLSQGTCNGFLFRSFRQVDEGSPGPQPPPVSGRPARRTILEIHQLEDRNVPAAITWAGALTGGSWATGTNWAGGVAPGANDTATINTAVTGTITLDGAVSVNQFIISNAGASLTLANGTGGSLTFVGANAGINQTLASSNNITADITMNVSSTFTATAATSILTLSGIVSGGDAASFTEAGAGTLIIINGANTYTGGTTLTGPANTATTVKINSIKPIGGGPSSLGNPAATNAAIIMKTGNPVLIYTGAGAASTDRPIDATAVGTNAATTLSEDSAAGLLTWSGSITAGGNTFNFTGASPGVATFAGALTSTARFQKNGTGTWVVTGNNANSASTTIVQGILQVGAGGTAGSIAGIVTITAGSLVFNHSDDVTFTQVITGAGSVVQAGTGNLVLKGANSYTGGTTAQSGILRAGVSTVGTTSGPFGGPAAGAALSVASGAVLDLQRLLGDRRQS